MPNGTTPLKPDPSQGGTCEKAPRWHRRAEARTEEILQASLEIFRERGYRDCRLDDVAARAGITKPLIYRYFRDKDDLIRRAIAWRMAALLAESRSARIERGDGWEAALLHLLEALWNHWTSSNMERFQTLMDEVREANPDLYREWMSQSTDTRIHLIRELLEEGLHRGEIRPDLDLESASRFLFAGLWQAARLHRQQIWDHPADPVAPPYWRTCADVFLRGARTAPEKGSLS